jgi:hypothetical protein
MNSGDIVLCTITTDMVLRIFAPVLDSPRHLQMQASVAAISLVPVSQRKIESSSARVFLWDPHILEDYARVVEADEDADKHQRLKKILNGDWDLFAVALIGETFVMHGIVVINVLVVLHCQS